MAVAVGTTGYAASSASVSVTVDSGSNRLFLAMASQFRSPPNLTDNATLGGVAPTGTLSYETNSTYRVVFWYWLEAELASVGEGTKTLTFTSSTTALNVGWLNASGVTQDAPEGTDLDIASGASSVTGSIPGASIGALLVSGGRANSTVSSYAHNPVIPTGSPAGMSYTIESNLITTNYAGVFTLVLYRTYSFAPIGVPTVTPNPAALTV